MKVGDLVSVSTFEGSVTHIGMRATTVKTWDHMEVLVPNALIFETSFTNWTRQDSIVRSVVTIRISRQDDPHVIRDIITDVLEKSDEVVSDPAPQVFLREIQEPLLEFELRYFIDLSLGRSRPATRSKVLFEIWEAFNENGIKPPHPQHDVHILSNFPKSFDMELKTDD